MTRNAAFRAQDSLDNIRDYFEDRADASCEPGDDRFRGNKEMSLLSDVQAVEDAVAALSQRLSDGITRWISVEERIPGDDANVIVHTHTGYVGTGWWNSDKERWHDTDSGATFVSIGENVTHWMPLPEAPK